MRKILNFNDAWSFTKETFAEIPTATTESWESVTLPHTWNAIDGQDGGNDYHRGTCLYAKSFKKDSLPEGELCYLDVSDFGVEIWKQLIYHKNKWISRALRAFLDFVIRVEFDGDGEDNLQGKALQVK